MMKKNYIKIILITIMFSFMIGLVENQETLSKEQEGKNLDIRPSVTYQGDTIFVQANQGGWAEFNGVKYQLQPLESNYVALIPIPLDQKPGVFEVRFHPVESFVFGNITARNEIEKVKLTIHKKEFSTQYLDVTEEQQTMIYNKERIQEDKKKYTEAMAKPIEEPLYRDAFLQPVEGRVTTMYGYTRYINGVLDSTHPAIDIAAPLGTPILAPNHGKVALADELYLTGNRVILDHGGNLFTSFSHLSSLNISFGDYVKKGDVIGWVGSTGFSTGPHLHLSVYVQGYPVNPEQFFKTNPFTW